MHSQKRQVSLLSKVYYEKRLRAYECTKVKNDENPEVTFLFSPPIDATMLIGNSISEKITGGACTIKLSRIPAGECKPIVYKNGRMEKVESIVICHGVSRKNTDEEYIRTLGKDLYELSEKLNVHSTKLSEIEELIKGKPII